MTNQSEDGNSQCEILVHESRPYHLSKLNNFSEGGTRCFNLIILVFMSMDSHLAVNNGMVIESHSGKKQRMY